MATTRERQGQESTQAALTAAQNMRAALLME